MNKSQEAWKGLEKEHLNNYYPLVLLRLPLNIWWLFSFLLAFLLQPFRSVERSGSSLSVRKSRRKVPPWNGPPRYGNGGVIREISCTLRWIINRPASSIMHLPVVMTMFWVLGQGEQRRRDSTQLLSIFTISLLCYIYGYHQPLAAMFLCRSVQDNVHARM